MGTKQNGHLNMLIPALMGIFLIFLALTAIVGVYTFSDKSVNVKAHAPTATPLLPAKNTPAVHIADMVGDSGLYKELPSLLATPTPYPTATPVWKLIRPVNLIDAKNVSSVNLQASIKYIVDMSNPQIIYKNSNSGQTTENTENSQNDSLVTGGAEFVGGSEDWNNVEFPVGDVEVPTVSLGDIKTPCQPYDNGENSAYAVEGEGFLSWGNGGWRYFQHLGTDMVCYSWRIVAPADGTVAAVFNRNLTADQDTVLKWTLDYVTDPAQQYGGSGICVVTTSYVRETGQVYFLMCHMDFGSVQVKAGDVVSRGQLLGTMGNTGDSKGAHLHYGVYVLHDDGTKEFLNAENFNAFVYP